MADQIDKIIDQSSKGTSAGSTTVQSGTQKRNATVTESLRTTTEQQGVKIVTEVQGAKSVTDQQGARVITDQQGTRLTTENRGGHSTDTITTGSQAQTEDAGFSVTFSLRIRGGLNAGADAPQDL